MTEALAERIEQATEPSRELDAEIALAVGWTYRLRGDGHCWFPPNSKYPWEHEMDAPPFTASIDAALTLVPEGLEWSVSFIRDRVGLPDEAIIYLKPFYEFEADDPEAMVICYGHTPSLALCTAALRAASASQAPSGG